MTTKFHLNPPATACVTTRIDPRPSLVEVRQLQELAAALSCQAEILKGRLRAIERGMVGMGNNGRTR